MSGQAVQGRIVWHDLYTTDLEQSKRFYGELFGWRIKEEGHWHLIYPGAAGPGAAGPGAAGPSDSDEHFGAVMALPPERKIPSHWLPYIAVTDLDAAVRKVTAAGGKLHVAKMEAGKTGVFSVAEDPTGAVFTLWQYTDGNGKSEVDAQLPPGRFCWDELITTNPAAAETFYTSVIGYGTQQMVMPQLTYTLWERKDALRPDGKPRQAGGMMPAPPGVPHSHWLAYVWVGDCDAATEKAQRLGAQVLVPPNDIPNVGRFACFLDPTKAAFAVLGALA